MFKGKKGNIYKIIFIIQTICIIICIPYLEYPDSSTYIKYINENKNLESIGIYIYNYILKNYFINDIIEIIRNTNYKGILSGTTIFEYREFYDYRFIVFQLVNIGILIIFYYIYKKIIRNSSTYIITFLLYITWPQINFYLLNITREVLIYIYTPLFIYFLLNKKYFLNFIILLLLYYYVDNTAIVNIYFLFIYICFIKFKNLIKIKNLLKVLIILVIGLFLIYRFQLYLYLPYKYSNILKVISEFDRSYHTKIVAFFMSSIFLAGHGNIILFPLSYILYLLYFFKNYLKIYKNFIQLVYEDQVLLKTTIFVISSLIIIVPLYSQMKYYTFHIFVIFYIIVKYRLEKIKVMRIFISMLFLLNLIYIKLKIGV